VTVGDKSALRRFALFQGVLPFDRSRLAVEAMAGITLAALAIPEVMGYTSIAGMPVITGLYTILLPVVAFAVLGSSRHLVVGADSATAALLAAGLAGLAVSGSDEYVALAGALALLAAVLLLVARLIGLGFLADFLSRTVLIGFLTGVGIQVACGQVGGLLGIPEGSGITIGGIDFDNTLGKLFSTLGNLGEISWTTAAVSAGVIVVTLGMKYVTGKIPGALIAVIGAIFISWRWDLEGHGVSVLGTVPGGLPSIGLPDVGWSEIPALFGTAISIFVLILAQSAATSRAYAARYNDRFSEDSDLVGLSAANVMAGVSGTFVVNGSPTKTQMVDTAGGRSQVAQLTMAAIVAIVLLFLTKPLAYLPNAVLAAVVFLIGIELVDLAGLRRVFDRRRDEFVVATLTAAVVVLVGVQQGIVVAIVASIIDHLRRSYRPPTAVIQRSAHGEAHAVPVAPDARSADGLVVYRFAASLYYANADHLVQEVRAMVEEDAAPVRWLCIDGAAMTDVDYTGGDTLANLHDELATRHIRLVFADLFTDVRALLDRYGVTDLIGVDAFFPDVDQVFEAYASTASPGSGDAGDDRYP
jgi:SulP family sulfate permease